MWLFQRYLTGKLLPESSWSLNIFVMVPVAADNYAYSSSLTIFLMVAVAADNYAYSSSLTIFLMVPVAADN